MINPLFAIMKFNLISLPQAMLYFTFNVHVFPSHIYCISVLFTLLHPVPVHVSLSGMMLHAFSFLDILPSVSKYASICMILLPFHHCGGVKMPSQVGVPTICQFISKSGSSSFAISYPAPERGGIY